MIFPLNELTSKPYYERGNPSGVKPVIKAEKMAWTP
jgi:hypothetical protein